MVISCGKYLVSLYISDLLLYGWVDFISQKTVLHVTYVCLYLSSLSFGYFDLHLNVCSARTRRNPCTSRRGYSWPSDQQLLQANTDENATGCVTLSSSIIYIFCPFAGRVLASLFI